MNRIELPARPRILVIALRRLGDVLLTTPLIRSVRRAWPDAHIEALVFADTAGILAGNPDLNSVITMTPRPSLAQTASLAVQLWRRYDLAISTQSGDRPTYFSLLAGRQSVAPVEERFSGRLKRALLGRSIDYVHASHRVEQMLRLADGLGIARVPEMVAPKGQLFEGAPAGPYAVIHAAPFFRYKQWTAQGWRDLAAALSAQGLVVVATGGPAAEEKRYLDDVWSGANVTRFDGKLTWPQLSGLLANARVYAGPDTSVTHLAAATGCPTVAIYGPTDPRLWGPFPAQGLDAPWPASGAVERRGNVSLVQNPLPCMPCQLEGCERRLNSNSVCLDELPASRVIEAVVAALR
ncbi:MAG TPA: glycosyltransferase family 9 protein [Pseudolabrys sp.]|jgi:heptosyltransferase-3